jgi:hypothetical protein
MGQSITTNKHVTPEHVLEALVECKRLMDEYNFLSSYFLSKFSSWNYLRVFLLDKQIIKSRHNSYVWNREKPNEELAKEYVLYYNEVKKNEKLIPKVTINTSPNKIYEDYVALQKELGKLKLENREMFKDLKEHYQGRIRAEKAYMDLSNKIKNVFYEPEKDTDVIKFSRRRVEDGFIKFLNKKL